jgi:hypothetical protein
MIRSNNQQKLFLLKQLRKDVIQKEHESQLQLKQLKEVLNEQLLILRKEKLDYE